MPQISSVENNFTKGLITEFTGLNFPENAATDTDNCVYEIVGDVTRRVGINYEDNVIFNTVNRSGFAVTEYIWDNPGGDGSSKLFVKQVGNFIQFYNIATSTVAQPLSSQIIGSVDISAFAVSFDVTSGCNYADGNGYLFIYQKSIDPVYVTYNPVTLQVVANSINVQIRDFVGVIDGLSPSTRPPGITPNHLYNLFNQGYVKGSPWTGASTTSYSLTAGSTVFTIATGLTIANGTTVAITYTGAPITVVTSGGDLGIPISTTLYSGTLVASGVVTGYTSGSGALTINITSVITPFTIPGGLTPPASWSIVPNTTGMVDTFVTAIGLYPSNSDIWWYFKNSSGAFDPATTGNNVTLTSAQAPRGHYILPAFSLNRVAVSGIGVTTVSTPVRPTSGCWYAGRTWYTGVSASQASNGDNNFYTWTENIYFSQVVETTGDFGLCYQTNDPTSDQLNGLLPTDGGVVTIVGSGVIHKLFPIANGLLVFANNGIWFITGNQGIGFAANDYTVTKISSVKVLSSRSFVDVLGLPFFWNLEGIYQIIPGQNGSLGVEPITVGTILSFYNEIPFASKKYAKGSYDPINYTIQWVFRSTNETTVTDRYQYDRVLNFNTYNKAFFPYTVSQTSGNYITGIAYVSYPQLTSNTPDPAFKFTASVGTIRSAFAEEMDTTYLDWGTDDYTSFFVTGYKVHGKGQVKFQIPYVFVYNRNTEVYSSYYIQGQWDYATTSDSGDWGTAEFAEILEGNRSVSYKRHRIRGRGMTLQLKFSSVSGKPFDLIGWSINEVLNAGV